MSTGKDCGVDAEHVRQILIANYHDLTRYVARRIPRQLLMFSSIEDVVQDVCCEAIRCYPASRPLDVRSWLFGIAKLHMLEMSRHHRALKRGARKVIGEESLSRDERDTVVLLQDLALFERTPSLSAVRKEALVALSLAIEKLPAIQQRVVRLRYIDGLTVGDVAAAVGLTDASVWQHARRGLKALRTALIAINPRGC